MRAYCLNNAISVLHNYRQRNNQFYLCSKYIITMSNSNLLSIDCDSWKIILNETQKNMQRKYLLKLTQWMTNINYKFSNINEKFMIRHSFGFYVSLNSKLENQSA